MDKLHTRRRAMAFAFAGLAALVAVAPVARAIGAATPLHPRTAFEGRFGG